jgi:signal transduction histidine kinase
VDLHEKIKL